jgi:hypothetical protein
MLRWAIRTNLNLRLAIVDILRVSTRGTSDSQEAEMEGVYYRRTIANLRMPTNRNPGMGVVISMVEAAERHAK